ncbi:hypothetical protein ACFX1X_028740 [Malus domestica]
MAKHGDLLVSYALSIIFILLVSLPCEAVNHGDRKTYIVYLGSLPKDDVFSPLSHHIGILERVAESSSASNLLVRSYKRSFNGFAAKLTDRERERVAKMKEVSNVIVGVIDTGIWPESESFSDEGFGPAPRKWEGVCEGGKNFTCNNKIIGARFYVGSSARDDVGHGTHTASTAAGNPVRGVSFYGLAHGTATGGVPSARIATYKVCGSKECATDKILAAFDDAIADGVDIITISIGSTSADPFDRDAIAIGAFHALEKGILTSQSAGNGGPYEGSVSSVAPWILTVAASSIDRRIIDKVVLGNRRTLVGNSAKMRQVNVESDAGCLDPNLVKGKIVVCRWAFDSIEVRRVGAIGALSESIILDDSGIVPLPAASFSSKDFDLVKSYVNSTGKPRAKLPKSEVIKDLAAPTVASFSSRGPNFILPEIIKPDITAPGVDILAAYSPVAPLTESVEDRRHVKYSFLSGTSMSCPHAAGVAAYIKTFHPNWSPAAIKSSIMTTAGPVNSTDGSYWPGVFSYGSGHINPLKALNPGLVYETSKDDYIKLLCSILDESKVRLISGDKRPCPARTGKKWAKDLNYPSLAGKVVTQSSFSIQFQRTVKNVGHANSTYKAKTISKPGVNIKVVPQVLSFKSLNEKKTFNVTVSGRDIPSRTYVSASLVWTDGTHSVRSPILLRLVLA